MNFGVYVHYVNKFVMLYNRLPSLEEQQKAKQDFDENRVYKLARRISDTLKTNKTPCERCRDYFAYKAYDTQEDFMQGTFKNRSEAEQIASSSVIAYQPLTPIGTFTTVSDKMLNSMQYNLLSDEELAYQLALYNALERTNLEPIDEDAFSLQVMLWFNPELVCKPYAQYQYALFYKMLYGEPSTQYARVLDIGGKVTKLRIAQMLATQSKGNVTFSARDLDDVIARIQHPARETVQRGLMAFDLDMEGVHMQAEVSHLDALTAVLSALAGLSSQELLTIQKAKTEQELREAVRQISVRLGWMPVSSDQPIPEQQVEFAHPFEPENVRGYRQMLSLVFYIKKLCTETHQIIPFLRAAGEVVTNEADGQIARAEAVPTSLKNSRRWILPYLEYAISGGTIKNLSDAQIVRQVQAVFAR